MREIKFRGYGKDEKVKYWIYGNLLDEKLIGLVAIQDEKCHVWEVDPESVGQFTGLRDSDGREIYEGDVVRDENCICLVVYNSTRFASFALRKDGWAFDHYFGEAFEASECQVIGNIYDNPELLRCES